jgi:hypothetical protein
MPCRIREIAMHSMRHAFLRPAYCCELAETEPLEENVMNAKVAATKTDGLPSKRRLGFAGAMGIIGCAICCTLPLLAAVVLGGGAASAVASFVTPGMGLAVGGVVFAGALGLGAFRARARRQRTR